MMIVAKAAIKRKSATYRNPYNSSKWNISLFFFSETPCGCGSLVKWQRYIHNGVQHTKHLNSGLIYWRCYLDEYKSRLRMRETNHCIGTTWREKKNVGPTKEVRIWITMVSLIEVTHRCVFYTTDLYLNIFIL